MTMDQQFDSLVGELFEATIAPMVAKPELLSGLRTLLRESFYAGASALMQGGCASSAGTEERAQQRRMREIEVTAHVYGKRAELFNRTFGPVQ